MRSILLLIITLVIGGLAALNWGDLTASSSVSLGVTTIQAPLGVLMLVLTALLCVVFIAYVLALQGSVMLEARRHSKEMAGQRELADKAEASRFIELRQLIERQHAEGQAALLARIDELQLQLLARAQESDNSTAAYMGQLDERLSHTHEQRSTPI